MTNYKDPAVTRPWDQNTRIAEACGCARSTVISTLQYATAKGLKWDSVRDWTEKEVADAYFGVKKPGFRSKPATP